MRAPRSKSCSRIVKRHGTELTYILWRSSFWPGWSAVVRGLVIHDIKEVEGVEIGDEVNGEVEEITHRAHET